VSLDELDLLLPVIGGLFVAETAFGDHAGDQLSTLRSTDISDCALPSHLEMHDWPEFTIIVRLWIVAGFSRCSDRIFYGDFLKIAKVV